ncbi:hypothetical protein AXK59_12180 [Tsukamurella tyrosinosolvens]|nr:hypothetical protein AXK59_12180 [Tsukamurella tyrosinosolvens]KZL96044.1 hypothetical protein AXX05_23285 [Tsukamurella tyrosinosolvens]
MAALVCVGGVACAGPTNRVGVAGPSSSTASAAPSADPTASLLRHIPVGFTADMCKPEALQPEDAATGAIAAVSCDDDAKGLHLTATVARDRAALEKTWATLLTGWDSAVACDGGQAKDAEYSAPGRPQPTGRAACVGRAAIGYYDTNALIMGFLWGGLSNHMSKAELIAWWRTNGAFT